MDAILHLIETVGCMTEDVGLDLDCEDDEADLRSLAATAKRGAILLPHAAFAAEQAAAKAKASR